jgi:ABC-type methionine transport system ATPase subunit
MEFLLYLSTQQMDVYKMVSNKVRVVENAPICKKYDIFGFYNTAVKLLTICTSKLKQSSDPQTNVNETLMHESVHVAQSCKTKFAFLDSFGINPSLMSLSYQKEQDLKKVIAFDSRLKNVDREAFWMEDKPEKVKYVVQKYCF